MLQRTLNNSSKYSEAQELPGRKAQEPAWKPRLSLPESTKTGVVDDGVVACPCMNRHGHGTGSIARHRGNWFFFRGTSLDADMLCFRQRRSHARRRRSSVRTMWTGRSLPPLFEEPKVRHFSDLPNSSQSKYKVRARPCKHTDEQQGSPGSYICSLTPYLNRQRQR